MEAQLREAQRRVTNPNPDPNPNPNPSPNPNPNQAQRRVTAARAALQDAKVQSEAAAAELEAARREVAQLREAVRARFGEADDQAEGGARLGRARGGGAPPSLDELQRR